jgi:2-methylcitrate dehydratase PrpD
MDAVENFLSFGLDTRFEDLPPEVIERTRLALLDTLGAAVAGIRGEGVAALSALVCDWGGKPQATALSGGMMLPLPHAALLNGVAARAWDLDDVHEQNTCHINVNIVPAVLALAEARAPVNGREFITALAVGAETVCRLSSAPRISFSESGSCLSYQCGFYGSALASARLLGLDKDRARHALGIAHARVAGNQQGYLAGAMTVRLMQGVAVEGGLVSALMAQCGLTGSSEILEGRFGYYPVYHRGKYDRAALLDGLGGTRWLALEPSIKPPYPCCKFTHGPIEATVAAVGGLGVKPEDIEHITVKVTNREVHDLVCLSRERKWNPQSLTDAQFSLPFTVAYAAVHGGVDLETFQPAGLADKAVRALLPRIEAELEVDAQGEGRGTFPMPGIVTVTDRNGRTLQKRVEYVKGHPKNPMTYAEVAQKFRQCAALGLPGWDGAEAVIDAVGRIETLADAGTLARLCLAQPARAASKAKRA